MSGGLRAAHTHVFQIIAFIADHWRSAQLRLTDQRPSAATENANGSITLADPNNGPLVRWAAKSIETFTQGAPVGAGFTILAHHLIEGKLILSIEREKSLDVKDA